MTDVLETSGAAAAGRPKPGVKLVNLLAVDEDVAAAALRATIMRSPLPKTKRVRKTAKPKAVAAAVAAVPYPESEHNPQYREWNK